MAFNFPDTTGAPTDGSFTHTEGDLVYVWNGEVWECNGGGGSAGSDVDLQTVTDNGNSTSNEIVVDGVNIGSGPGAGVRNTRVGSDALGANTTGGSKNTAVGNNALFSSTGSYNTCIGQSAGVSLTDGDNNTIIGGVGGTAGMANTMLFGAGPVERFRVDANGRFLVGPTSSGINVKAIFQGSSGNANAQGIVAIARGSDGTGGVRTLGSLYFTNNAHAIGAQIDCNTAEAWTATTRPSHLIFSTNGGGDGANTEERMRIASDGNVEIGGTPGTSPNISLNADGSSKFKNVTSEPIDVAANGGIDLNSGVFFHHGGGTLGEPTNYTTGQSGLIYAGAEITAYHTSYKNQPAGFPANSIAPFYCKSSTEIVLGTPTTIVD